MRQTTTGPEKQAKQERRAQMRELLKDYDIKDMADINELFKEMVGTVL